MALCNLSFMRAKVQLYVETTKVFFDFLRFCIGSAKEIPGSLKEVDWKELYAIAMKQALLGVLFYGIQRLPKELAPEQKLLMQWMVMAEQIRKQNIRLFQDSVKVCQNFENEGFANCILKGQGNALLYPDPYMRTPGDIDIYLLGGRRKIMKYVDQVCPNQVMRYHHVDFPVMKTAIEVHFTPSYMFCPIHNRRMQKWFEEVMGEQCNHRVSLPDGYGEIHVPTASFNVIYILSHLYRHIFTEGIGLRQLLNYYYVLISDDLLLIRDRVQKELKHLGLWKFAQAVMFVVKEVFGLSEDRMIAPMAEKEGKFLLDEIMRGGNFGQFDDRMGDKVDESKIHRYFRMNLRNLRFVRHYPTEAFCEPFFRTWFAGWKYINRIK